MDLLQLIREEWELTGKDWTKPGFRAMAVYRFGRWARVRRPALRGPLLWIYERLFRYVRNHHGIEIHLGAKIGRRCWLVHQNGICIHPYATIGDDCAISQMVTIGAVAEGKNRPVLGNRVEVGVGAVIVGNITVGDDAKIAPNAVVMKDVPPGASVVGNPARVIPGLSSLSGKKEGKGEIASRTSGGGEVRQKT